MWTVTVILPYGLRFNITPHGLLLAGAWSGSGILGPEAFDADPFLELLTAYGSPWGIRDDAPAG